MFWVANNTVEVLERAALIVSLETFLSALVSYLLYKALKNLNWLAKAWYEKGWENMNKKYELYFETIVCMGLGIVLLSIATYFEFLPREVQLAPDITVMIDYINVSWMYFVAMALFIIPVVRVQRYRAERTITN
jgi:hypothetical protein